MSGRRRSRGRSADGREAHRGASGSQISRSQLNSARRPASLAGLLFLLGIGLFLFTRFYRLAEFPIAFNSDEVVTVVRAVDLVRDGFFDYEGRFLPTFFNNDNKYSLGATVYAQVIPYLLFGKSIWAARGVAVLIGLLGVIWTTLMLRDSYRVIVLVARRLRTDGDADLVSPYAHRL